MLVYFLYISTWKALADRYLLPILPLLVLLAVRLCVDAVRLPKKGRTAAAVAVAAVLAVALGAPLVSSLEFNGTLAGADTRLTAKAWVEENLPAGSVIAAENYGPPLLRAEDAGYWAGRGDAPPAYRLYSLALPSPTVPEPTHSLAWVRERDVEYVIVSSTVSQRVLAAAHVYPEIVAFYEALEEEAELG